MAKKIVKLTESQLHELVAKAVKKTLSEGKFSNNVPRFETVNGKPFKKGEYAPATAIDKKYGRSNWSLFRDALKNGGDDWERSKESTEAWSKHNDRVWSEFDDKLALKKKGEVLGMQQNKREWADFLGKRGLKPEEVENMPSEQFSEVLSAYMSESKIRNAISESVRHILNEWPAWADMDLDLENAINELGASISRFYSDEGTLVVKLDNIENKEQVRDEVESRGYELYDTGANGQSLMMTFNRK